MDLLRLEPRGVADFDLFPYVPSAGAGWTFVVLFGITAIAHFVLMIIYQSWFFIPFILGCIGEAAGYYGRAWASQNIRNGTPYLLQMMLILGSAPLLAATVYMTLGRIIRGLGAEEHSVVRSNWISKIYITIDIASFVCQIMGTAAQASGAEGAKKGMQIVMWGLAIQLIAFAFFLAMTTILHQRLLRVPTATSQRSNVPWERVVWILYVVSTLIIARSVFRFIEFAEGAGGSIYKTEALMYVFDASLLFLTAVYFAIVHPGKCFRSIARAGLIPVPEDDTVPLRRYRK